MTMSTYSPSRAQVWGKLSTVCFVATAALTLWWLSSHLPGAQSSEALRLTAAVFLLGVTSLYKLSRLNGNGRGETIAILLLLLYVMGIVSGLAIIFHIVTT